MATISLNWADGGKRFDVETSQIVTYQEITLWGNEKREVRIRRPFFGRGKWSKFPGTLISLCDGSDRAVIQSIAEIDESKEIVERNMTDVDFYRLAVVLIAEWKRQS